MNSLYIICKNIQCSFAGFARSREAFIKKALIFVTFLAAFALTGCSKKTAHNGFTLEDGVLKVGVEIGYPPFEYFAVDGKTPLGFDIALARECARRLNLEPRFIDTAWDGIFAGLDAGRYDIIVSAVAMTEMRKARYDFSDAYIGNGQSIIVRKDSALDIKEPADLKGKKIGYQAECASDFFMERKASEGLNFTKSEYDKVMNAYDDLRLGRIDAVVSDYLVAVSYLEREDSAFKAVWIGDPDECFGICMKKGRVELTAKLNAALAGMKADGTLKKLYIETFGTDLSGSVK
ncbi:MAG: ABC transporter substrate-binding protein [Treponema sp.]